MPKMPPRKTIAPRVTAHERQEIEAKALFERLLRSGEVRISHRVVEETPIPGMEVGTWVFGMLKVTGGTIKIEYLGDSPLPNHKRK